jgi:cytoplasmic iron level regulating protein YaaA (DUF328/UPF0246 family)
VFILLPPSESKASGGHLPPLRLDGLLFPHLRAARERMLAALAAISGDLPAARSALGVGAAQDREIADNVQLATAPTMPALHRYTGVLYEAVDVPRMTAAERARADARVLITSALFGVLGAADAIPAYRLSAQARLPGMGSVAAVWRAPLTPLLAGLPGPVVDLRSGAYAAFAPVPGAVTVRVVSTRPDGSRAVVSHFNKATKGRLARLLATSRAEPRGVTDVARVARRAGMTVERIGPAALQIVT